MLKPKHDKKSTVGFLSKQVLGNQVVGFPFGNIASSFHPTIMGGVEYKLNKNVRHTLAVAFTSFLYKNKTIGNTFATSLDFLYRYTHKSGLFSDVSVDIGSIYQVHPRTVYELNQTTMEYNKTTDNGKFSSQVGFGVGVGYDFNIKFNKPFKIFLRNNFILQTPYFDSKQFPIMPQNVLNVGVTWSLPKMNFKSIFKRK